MNMDKYCLYDNIIFICTYLIIILYIIHIHNLISFIHTPDCKCNDINKLIYIRNWFFVYLFLLTIVIIYNLFSSHLNYCINFIILIPHYIYTIIYMTIMIFNIILIIYFHIHLKSLMNKYSCIHLKYNQYLNSYIYKYVIYSLIFFFFISILITVINIGTNDYKS